LKLQLPRFLREDSRHGGKAKEQYKAAFDPVGTSKPARVTFRIGEYSWKDRCKHYDEITNDYSLAKIAPFTLAGLTTAQGVYFQPAKNKVNDQDKPTPSGLDQDAFDEVELFKRDQQVNSKFYETTWRAAKYGGCFWEITFDPVFGFRLPPMQENIEPKEADAQGTITKWRQVNNSGVEIVEWTSDELVLVPFLGVTTETWPFAPSIFMGTETELEMLTGVEESAKDYSVKQAWPYEVLQVGSREDPVSDGEYNQARTEWRNRKPGEGIVTSVPTDIKPGGTGSSPIRDLAVLCELMKDNVQDSVMIAPISKLYNSTEASAKEMTKHIMSVLGQPWQWQISSYFEQYILKPWIVASGYSVRSCPQVVFESPDVHKKEEGEYWTSLVQSKIQTPQQACDHLGLEYDQVYWDAQLKQQQEQFKQQLDAKAQANPDQKQPQNNQDKPKPTENAPKKIGEKWIVERIPRDNPNS
jgi:hypothetical protein